MLGWRAEWERLNLQIRDVQQMLGELDSIGELMAHFRIENSRFDEARVRDGNAAKR